jgi:hypothetical protein
MFKIVTLEAMLTVFKERLREGIAGHDDNLKTRDGSMALIVDYQFKTLSVYFKSHNVVGLTFQDDRFEWKQAVIGTEYGTPRSYHMHAAPFMRAYEEETKRRRYDVTKG